MTAEERRRAQRIDVSIPLDISGDGESNRGETINISMNGIYFRLGRHIEPLTKVRMGIVIPGEDEEEGDSKAKFDGVVVRTEPEESEEETGDYRIAVYITYMSNDSRKVLSDFISRHI
jgi:hypothetical protein